MEKEKYHCQTAKIAISQQFDWGKQNSQDRSREFRPLPGTVTELHRLPHH